MILAVAERANIKGVPPEQRESFRAEWEARWKHPRRRIRYMLGLNSMVEGCQSRQRMTSLLGLPADVKTINLLWPDCVPGTWDDREGVLSGLVLMEYIGQERGDGRPTFTGMVLLGRRVAKAFRLPDTANWGDRFDIRGADDWYVSESGPVIVLPHPSGRSTVLSDPHVGAAIRASVAKFVEEHDDRLPHAPTGAVGDGGQDPGAGPGAGIRRGIDAHPPRSLFTDAAPPGDAGLQ